MTNRDRPATSMTKREEAALRILAGIVYDHTHVGKDEQHMRDLASFAIDLAEELFDQLTTPQELRDEPDVVCTEIKWGRVRP